MRASAGCGFVPAAGELGELLSAGGGAGVRALKVELAADRAAASRRRRAAQERGGARARGARVAAALAELPAVEAAPGDKEGQGAGLDHRSEAPVMKMADGGFRPLNVQLAAEDRASLDRRRGGRPTAAATSPTEPDGRPDRRALASCRARMLPMAASSTCGPSTGWMAGRTSTPRR
ncbi:MAG: hypothetical protein R3D28_03855 [Geminicoccaceae bacterium]